MLPSSTVENYLKAIYQAQAARKDDQGLVPVGQLAAAVGVVPGTATTMVKALAESGLVSYEPYTGVRLTTAGGKLAAMVLRRHRLIELFLVQILGMSWTEVHDEAERLEHAASDRLIERIDHMLGQPSVDPHGDPIPGPEGTVEHHEYYNLLNCPLQTSVVVTRVTDQDAKFLHFLETSNLKPGQSIEVEARDPAADSVCVRNKNDRRITIGMRAASKLLVELGQAVSISLLLATGVVHAQPPTPSAASRPFEILDNSFLVEEAFNQEPGVFQNILTFTRSADSEWDLGFTQEWPVGTQTHQVSYTVPFQRVSTETGLGDVQIHYRLQATTEAPGRPAFSPRFTVILPSGSKRRGLGAGTVGWQVNLPFSKQAGDVYWHWNGGVTYLAGVHVEANRVGDSVAEGEVGLVTPHVSASAIWRAAPMLNLLLEAVAEFQESVDMAASSSTSRTTSLTISPGFRGGWNINDHQVIVGLAVPLSFADGNREAAVFMYFSYELPFRP